MEYKNSLSRILVMSALVFSPLFSNSQNLDKKGDTAQKIQYERINERLGVEKNNYEEILNRAGASDTSQLTTLPGGYVTTKDLESKIEGLAQINSGKHQIINRKDFRYSIIFDLECGPPSYEEINKVAKIADGTATAGQGDKVINEREYDLAEKMIYEKTAKDPGEVENLDMIKD